MRGQSNHKSFTIMMTTRQRDQYFSLRIGLQWLNSGGRLRGRLVGKYQVARTLSDQVQFLMALLCCRRCHKGTVSCDLGLSKAEALTLIPRCENWLLGHESKLLPNNIKLCFKVGQSVVINSVYACKSHKTFTYLFAHVFQSFSYYMKDSSP